MVEALFTRGVVRARLNAALHLRTSASGQEEISKKIKTLPLTSAAMACFFWRVSGHWKYAIVLECSDENQNRIFPQGILIAKLKLKILHDSTTLREINQQVLSRQVR